MCMRVFAQMEDFDLDEFGRPDNVAPDQVEDETGFIGDSEPVVGSTTGAVRDAETAVPARTAVAALQQKNIQSPVNDYER